MTIALSNQNTIPNVNPDGNGGHYPVVQVGKQDGSGNFVADPAAKNVTVLPSAARTATTAGADMSGVGYRGVIVYLNITVASGAGGLKCRLKAKDPLSGNYSVIANQPGTAITATGFAVFIFHPTASLNAPSPGGTTTTVLPVNFAIEISAGDSSSYTYSVTADLLP